MEIRALTGFNEETIRNYGRSYSPLSGYTALGAVDDAIILKSKGLSTIPVNIPAIVPPQQLKMTDPVTKKTKIVTVQNVTQLADLLTKGFSLLSQVKGSGGVRTVVVPSKPKSGLSTELMISIGALALIFLFIGRK
jgi:hypothetical protein